MKELSIEEKAKRYDEALAMAKECITYIPDKAVNKYMLSMFPELKETEDGRDERIRKEIIKYIESRKITPNHPIADEWIAWLEKQGNNANKVKSIFEVGKWIVANVSKYTFLLKRGAPRFQAEGTNGDIYSFYLLPNGEKEYHLWSIKDAKDGDVLCTYECGKPKIVFILKGTPKRQRPCVLSYHCYYNIMYPYFEHDSKTGCLAPNDEDVKPATKEQRDLLFQKMKEAGYEWNEDKKELIKL